MPFKLDPTEPAVESLRRCADEQLEAAIAELSERFPEDPVEAVHAARKAVKRERALLRLARPSLSRAQRRRENAALRDAARRLSSARDAEVIVQALDDLESRYAGQLTEATFEAFRRPLAARRQTVRTALAQPSQAREELAASRTRLNHVRWRRDGWAALERGLMRSYSRGAKAFSAACARGGDERLHEWRKRTKDLWHQLELLSGPCGKAVAGQAKEAHRLSSLLGDDHDLAVLRAALVELEGEVAGDLDGLLGLVEHRRAELQAHARLAGAQVYAEKPRAFTRRLRKLWRAGTRRAELERSRDPAALAQATRARITT